MQDATQAARKALSCVYRTGQRFGVTYLVDVLLGKSSERIVRFEHDRQSTFGIGQDLDASEWRNLFRQLIARGLLAVDVDGHGSIMLTEASRPVLRGEQTLHLRKLTRGSGKKTGTAARRKSPVNISDADQSLWEALRGLRKQLSDLAGVPAYVVFSNSTLEEMVVMKPRDTAEMATVSGVGSHKLEQYGQQFLQVIREHQ